MVTSFVGPTVFAGSATGGERSVWGDSLEEFTVSALFLVVVLAIVIRAVTRGRLYDSRRRGRGSQSGQDHYVDGRLRPNPWRRGRDWPENARRLASWAAWGFAAQWVAFAAALVAGAHRSLWGLAFAVPMFIGMDIGVETMGRLTDPLGPRNADIQPRTPAGVARTSSFLLMAATGLTAYFGAPAVYRALTGQPVAWFAWLWVGAVIVILLAGAALVVAMLVLRTHLRPAGQRPTTALLQKPGAHRKVTQAAGLLAAQVPVAAVAAALSSHRQEWLSIAAAVVAVVGMFVGMAASKEAIASAMTGPRTPTPGTRSHLPDVMMALTSPSILVLGVAPAFLGIAPVYDALAGHRAEAVVTGDGRSWFNPTTGRGKNATPSRQCWVALPTGRELGWLDGQRRDACRLAIGDRVEVRYDPYGWFAPVPVDDRLARPVGTALAAAVGYQLTICAGLLIFARVLRRREQRWQLGATGVA